MLEYYRSHHSSEVRTNRSRRQGSSKSSLRRSEHHHTENSSKHRHTRTSSRAPGPLLQFPSNQDEASMSDLYIDDDKSFFQGIFSPLNVHPTGANSLPTGCARDGKREPREFRDPDVSYPSYPKDSWEGFHSNADDVQWEWVNTLLNIYKRVDKDRLPWQSDFMNLDRMSFPSNSKEVLSRINLNVPYYALNYLELSCMITLPFLFFYNLPFFVVYFITSMLVYGVLVNGIKTSQSHNFVCLWGFQIAYHILGHTLLFAYLVILLFFDGVKTGLVVFWMNLLIVIPHAIWRTPPYFDDEKLEKCRPRLVRYALMLIMLFLVYLEGELLSPEEEMLVNENLSNAQKERERLKITFKDTPEY
ncbi:unnamed protein product [Phytomonas sp. EM1]|nr:unnamed protein product [Phytomonas sp. EM1]|eukprot:CCW63151.1 unnamed protein product [Phytomonas sp. isolate EM1]